MNAHTDIQIFSDKASMVNAAVKRISDCAAYAIKQYGRFVWVLAGGNTPKDIYQQMTQTEQDWAKWHLIYGDERYLPVQHPDRNETMVQESFGETISFLQHYPMPYSGDINADAKSYQETIATLLPAHCCLLGIGEDGHTASLFANIVEHEQSVYPVLTAPKPPAQRLTLAYLSLNHSDHVLFIACGEEKIALVKQHLHEKILPFSRINGRKNTAFFLCH